MQFNAMPKESDPSGCGQMIPNHVQHVIKIFKALPLLIFYSVKSWGEPGSRVALPSHVLNSNGCLKMPLYLHYNQGLEGMQLVQASKYSSVTIFGTHSSNRC